MQIYYTIKDLRLELLDKRKKIIALVPTMGNLHDGHLQLVKIAREHADIVVVSIFVNPTQFGVGEDFDSYPRTLEADIAKLKTVNADYVFAPSVAEMYPTFPPNIQVLSGTISKILCAKTRPTHFDGVGLVVGKLFNIVRPDIAVFGKKDYQQLAIIRQLNSELNFDIDIIGADIVRADDGLALSSRNGYLSDTERQTAPTLNRLLNDMVNAIKTQGNGQDLPAFIESLIPQFIAKINQAGFKVDYLEVLNAKLQPVKNDDKNLVILTASFLGKTRLLDNVEVNL